MSRFDARGPLKRALDDSILEEILGSENRPLVALPKGWSDDDAKAAAESGFEVTPSHIRLRFLKTLELQSQGNQPIGRIFIVEKELGQTTAWARPLIGDLYDGLMPGGEYWFWDLGKPPWPNKFVAVPTKDESLWPPTGGMYYRIPHQFFPNVGGPAPKQPPSGGMMWHIDMLTSKSPVTDTRWWFWRSAQGEQRWYSDGDQDLIAINATGLNFAKVTTQPLLATGDREIRAQEQIHQVAPAERPVRGRGRV